MTVRRAPPSRFCFARLARAHHARDDVISLAPIAQAIAPIATTLACAVIAWGVRAGVARFNAATGAHLAGAA